MDFLKVYGPITLLIAAGFVAAFQLVDPAPPRSLALATGSEQGAYHTYGKRYQEILAREGVEVILRPSRGSVENPALLRQKDDAGESAPAVDVAFLQSGIDKAEDAKGDTPLSLAATFWPNSYRWACETSSTPLTNYDLAPLNLLLDSGA